MTLKLFVSILLLSGVIAVATLFVSTIVSFSFGESVDVKIEDAAKLDAMNYREAMDYRAKHTIPVSFLETLRRRMVSPRGMYSFLGLLAPIFLTALISASEAVKIGRQMPDKTDRDTSWIKRV
jgi:hypothetical protein